MWLYNLEQNMFCTFLPTGHLSFYDPSPHSTNELINVVHLQVQGQKSDFNIVFIGGDGNMHVAARQTPISQGFLQVLTLWKMPCSEVLRFSTPRPETLYALTIVVM